MLGAESSVSAGSRIAGVDLLRIVAACSIVAFHVIPWKGPVFDVLLTWAVPFFFTVSGYFDARRILTEKVDFLWLRSRLLRLGVPYVFWTTLRLVDLRPINPGTLLFQFVLCAPTNTLWFLWTLMLVTILVTCMLRWIPLRYVAVIALVFGLLYSAVCQWWGTFGTVGSWLHTNPGYALQMPFLWIVAYVAGVVIHRKLPVIRLRRDLLLVAGLAILGVLCAAGIDPGGLAYNYSWGLAGIGHVCLGVMAFLAARMILMKSTALLRALAASALGVYLIHPVMIRLFKLPPLLTVFGKVVSTPVLFWVLVFVLSLLMTLVLRRIPLLKKVVA